MRHAAAMIVLLGLAGCTADRDLSGNPGPGIADAAASKKAPAGSLKPGSTLAALPDRGELLAYPHGRRMSPAVGAHASYPVDLSEAHAIGAIATGELRVTAPDGKLLRLRYERHVEHPDGNWTWVGRLPGDQGNEAILTFGARAVYGSIPQGGDRPPLRLTTVDGRARIMEPGPRLVAVLADNAKRAAKPDYFVPPRISGQPSKVVSAQAVGDDGGKATTTVDVVLGYTPGFRNSVGGDSQARTRLNFLVEIGNLALANSQLSVRWQLVHAMLVNYPDATDNGAALEQLTGFRAPSTQIPPGPEFAALRAAREQYGADLVSLVRRFQRPENNGCGIAWLIGGGQSAIGGGSDYFGYSVVSDGFDTEGSTTYFCRDETMAHEFGHNMGSQHDVVTARGDDGVLDSDEYGRYAYSFGYKTTPTTGNFFTIMAYGDSGQTPNRIFSNPRVTNCAGRPCGIANQADNALSLSQTASTIAAFRATIIPPDGPPVARYDVDGNGRSDLLWSRATPGQFVTWSMGAGPPIGATRAYAVSTSYRAIGSGDLDGNGRADVIWMDISNGDVHAWLSQVNNTYVDSLIYRLGTSWTLAGVGDANGDGKDDLLWSRPSTGQFAYWLMNGGVLAGSRGFAVSSAYKTIGVGDLDGNGRVDVLWQNAAGNIQVWLGRTDGLYDSRAVYTLSTGWTLLGTGDVNDDRKADLLWIRQGTSQFVQWVMNGAAIASSAAFPIQGGESWTWLGSGDFNGDGAADLIARNSGGGMFGAGIYRYQGMGMYYSIGPIYQNTLTDWTLLR